MSIETNKAAGVIQVENLTKMYAENYAIKDVCFSVNKGEIVGFLGPNGAGKSTTMKILTCFISATRGTARIKDKDVFEDSLYVRRMLGYLPESIPLYPEITVKAYLNFIADIKGIPKETKQDYIEKSVLATQIKEMFLRPMGRLSKGFRQRVGLAQALLGDPEILILDEPTVGLDPAQIIEIRKLISELGKEKTIILSTHILPEVEMLCDRVIIINRGRIVAQNTHDGLAHSLKANERLEITVAGPKEDVENKIKEITHVGRVHYSGSVGQDKNTAAKNYHKFDIEMSAEGKSDEIARIIVQNNWGLREMKITRLSLEDVFVSLVTEENLENHAQQ